MAHLETNVEYGKCTLDMTDEEYEARDLELEKLFQESIRTGNLYIDEHTEYSPHIPFLLTPYAAEMPKILEHIEQTWNITLPRIVLFVFSECEGFCYDNYRKISKKLSKGLAYALNTTEMWLFAHGIDTGFSKDIGKEVENQLSRRRSIDKNVKKKRSSFPTVALIGICERNILKFASKFQREEATEPTDAEQDDCPKFDINRNFGYFMVVEDTTTTRKGVSQFILNLTQHLVHQPMKRIGDKLPVMSILLNGKLAYVDTVLGMLKHELPVIVLDGSGGLADLLAFAFYHNASGPEGIDRAVYSESVLKPQVVNRINLHYPSLPEQEVARVAGKIFDCIRKSGKKNQQFLTVLDLDSVGYEPSKLPHLLLKALFKAHESAAVVTPEQLKSDLVLTMEWNSVDVAQAEVFALDRSSTFQVDDDLFFRALTKPNREEFAAVYLEKGFQVHTFLNSATLINLFQYSLTREFFRAVVWESVLGLGSHADISRGFLDSKLIILIEELTGIPSLLNSYELDWNSRCIYDDRSATEAERKAMVVLVMWAILSHRVKLVKVLIRHSEQPVHLALACFIILRKLEPHVSDLTLKKEMIEHADEFSEMAADIMTLCYESVPCRALDVLNEKNRVWSYRALMELAAYAKNKRFLAHPCCQKYLDNQFMGKLRIRDLPYGDISVPTWLKILFSAFFIFPMFIWIRFEDPKEKESPAKESSADRPADEKAQGDSDEPLAKEETPKKQEVKYKEPGFFMKIYYLWTAPITKFWVFMVFYCLFLAFFSLAVIWPGCGNLFLDFFACIWIGSIIMDAIYQAYTLNKKYSSMPMAYRSLEIAFMIIFLFSYVMGRLVYMQNFMSSYSMKVMLCFGLLYCYYRLIFVSIPISSRLGPLLYRVKRMVRVDFVSYIRVVILIIISNGIVMHSIMFPEWPLSWELLRRAFFDAFVSFFLAPLADKFGEPDKKCVPLMRRPDGKSFYGFDPNQCRVSRYFKHQCNNPGVWAYIFGLQYYIILKLIAASLLFALFANTANKLEKEGKYIWKYQRYELVTNFANRLAMPPPLCLFTFAYMLGRYAYERSHDALSRYVFKKGGKRPRGQQPLPERLDEDDFRYWKTLAKENHENSKAKKQTEMTTKKRMEQLNALTDALNEQRVSLRHLDGHLDELMLEIRNAHQYLEGTGVKATVMERLLAKDVPQIFSRVSPYPGTVVERFPVSDNHVPWSCTWTSYDPISFTVPKEEHPPALAPYVDVDIQHLREFEGDYFQMPSLNWNAISVSPGGVVTDRKSWMVEKSGAPLKYDIDSEGLPMNPRGRTGLRGRGRLPRWGPNHFMYAVITRWNVEEDSALYLDAVLYSEGADEGFQLPGGYTHTEDERYEVVRSMFVCENRWKTQEDIEGFFRGRQAKIDHKSLLEKVMKRRKKTDEDEDEGEMFSAERIRMGYLDEAINTDQAWCEAEVWHYHYQQASHLEEAFKHNLAWYKLSEDVLKELPIGQASLVDTLARNMKAAL